MPTIEQAFKSVYVCQLLSNLYLSIEIFRYDEAYMKTIFILAKNNFDEEIQVVIYPDGEWTFIYD